MPPRSSSRKHALDPMRPLRIDDSYGKNNQLVPTRRSKRTQPVNEDEEDELLFQQVHEEEETRSARQAHVSEALHSLGAIDNAEEMPIENRLPETGPLGRVRAPMKPNAVPYTEDLWGVMEQKGARDLHRVGQLEDPNVTPYNSRHHPSEQPGSLAAKYGIVTGRGASFPLSPSLPDTSRSFNQENSLYNNANLHTPTPVHPLQDFPRNSPSPPSHNNLPSQNAFTLRKNNLQNNPSPLTNDTSSRGDSPLQKLPQPQKDPPHDSAQMQNNILPHTNHPPTKPSSRIITSQSNIPPTDASTTVQTSTNNTASGSKGYPPSDPPQVTRRIPWIPSKSAFQELSQRMGIRKKPDVFNEPNLHYGHTTRHRLTEADNQEIDALRRRMRIPEANQQFLKPAGSWEEPTLRANGAGKATSGDISTSLIGDAAVPNPKDRPVMPPLSGDTAAPPLKATSAASTSSDTVVRPSGSRAAGAPSTMRAAMPVGATSTPARPWIDRLLDVWAYFWAALGDILNSIPAILKMFVVFAILTALLAIILPGDGNTVGDRSLGLHWGGLSKLRNNVGHFIPSMRLPFWNSVDGGEYDIDRAVMKITTKTGTSETALPSLIHVKIDKNGKISIAPEFYHALSDHIAADDLIVKLKNARGASPEISEQVWLAIKRRLEREDWIRPHPSEPAGNTGPKTNSLARRDIEVIVDNQLTRSWESWLRHNSEAVSKILGHSVAHQLASKQEKEIRDYLGKYVNSEGNGTLVTRAEFTEQLRREVQGRSAEFDSELRGILSRIKEFEKELQKHSSTPGGMTKADVSILVDAAVRKAVSDAKLQAAARAGIKAHLAEHLENQINFFSVGSGAIVDPTYSSKAWQIPRYPFKSKKWLERDGYRAQPQVVALLPWREEGECFCAGPNLKGHGVGTNNVSVLISREIIPENLVVEHILPGATLDPEAMPREIEVWASFEELNLRHTIFAWSQTQFPNTPREVVLHTGFVKVGHFTYENRNVGDGVQVFRLSPELANMNAASSSFVVRALNNYGADHTCFYRIRMYGAVREREML